MTLDGLLELECISELTTYQDMGLFNSAVHRNRPHSIRMEDSWGYIIQATRNLRYKATFEDSLFIVSAKKDKSAVVIPNYFVTSINVLGEFLKQIHKATNLPVILKNVGVEQVPQLLSEIRDDSFVLETYAKEDLWSQDAPYDDQTFPQRIIDTKELLALEGKQYQKLRQEIHAFDRTGIRLKSKSYDPKYKLEVILLCQQMKTISPEIFEAHMPLLNLNWYPINHIIYEIKGKVVGFTLVYYIGNNLSYWALNTLLYDASVPHLSTKILYENIKISSKSCIRFINLQGSERKSLDRWKRKFSPRIAIHKTHLIYRCIS